MTGRSGTMAFYFRPGGLNIRAEGTDIVSETALSSTDTVSYHIEAVPGYEVVEEGCQCFDNSLSRPVVSLAKRIHVSILPEALVKLLHQRMLRPP